MKDLFNQDDKIKKICEQIKKETLEPALKEKEELEHQAQRLYDQKIKEGENKKQEIIDSAQKEIDKRLNMFQKALDMAKQQAFDFLKQELEKGFFKESVIPKVKETTQKEDVLKKLIEAAVKNIGDSDFELLVPSSIDLKKLFSLFNADFIEKVRSKTIQLDQIGGGCQLKLKDEHLTIDLSDKAIFDLIARFLRGEFHQYLR
jgi:V/A-type H+-transporting ATPase subunit E